MLFVKIRAILEVLTVCMHSERTKNKICIKTHSIVEPLVLSICSESKKIII